MVNLVSNLCEQTLQWGYKTICLNLPLEALVWREVYSAMSYVTICLHAMFNKFTVTDGNILRYPINYE